MDTVTDTRTRTGRLVRWLKDKIEKRQSDNGEHDPWWVTLMLDVGRPAVAIMILTMCAPGEHYLMKEARFHDPFAWLGPASLTAYAGIAAVVATKRPKGAPGHKTAVWGAVLAIALAMAAQPIAHLWGVKGLDLQHILLICIVSSVPSAVFGHLLHMGASAPKVRRTPAKPKADKRTPAPDTKPKWLTDNERTAARGGMSVSDLMSDEAPDAMTWTPDTRTPAGQPVTPSTDTRTLTPDIGTGSLAGDVRKYLTDNPDASNDDLYEAMRTLHPGKPDNSFYVARVRHERKIGKVS